jgi:acetate kinase
MKVLVINAGSSSIKYQLLDVHTAEVLAKGGAERIGIEGSLIKHQRKAEETVRIPVRMPDHRTAIKEVLAVLTSEEHGVLANMGEIDAVGHRVVHGGEKFSSSAIITAEVKQAIRACFRMAPLHNPPNMTGIDACEEAIPGVPQVAVFDTAFHQTMPGRAYMYALPYELYEKHGIRRYGFHGTSHAYVAGRAATMLGRPLEELRIVTCHLGNGSSVTAVECGRSIDTSMGMTPLAGICMGTRCGDIDPALVTMIMDREGLDMKGVDDLMNKKSGVAGVSGISSDFRDLDAAMAEGNPRAKLALDMFKYQCRKLIGAYAAAMGGVDAVVFTAGIGENNPDVRLGACEDLGFMGIRIDPEKNLVRGREIDISAEGATVRVLSIPTNEELAIASETERLVSALRH